MKAETYPFVMRNLPYEYSALAPCISAESLMIHHDRLYKTYVDRLNHALADYPILQKLSLTELLSGIENLPEMLRRPVKDFGGGVYAHELYFDNMQPGALEQDPKGYLQGAIIRSFGSVRDFREKLKEEVMNIFGSGYVWLVLDRDGWLSFVATKDQDTPALKNLTPLLNIDVWEHAYYLQYQNRREEYACAFMRLINWRKVGRRYEEGLEAISADRLIHGESSIEIPWQEPLAYEEMQQTAEPRFRPQSPFSQRDTWEEDTETAFEFAFTE